MSRGSESENGVATKERARRALAALESQGVFIDEHEYDIIEGFIKAAERKLPTEAAVEADRQRSRKR